MQVCTCVLGGNYANIGDQTLSNYFPLIHYLICPDNKLYKTNLNEEENVGIILSDWGVLVTELSIIHLY